MLTGRTTSRTAGIRVSLSTFMPTTKSALVGILSNATREKGDGEGGETAQEQEMLRNGHGPIGSGLRPLRPLQANVAFERSTPLIDLRWACSFCSSALTVRACLYAARSLRDSSQVASCLAVNSASLSIFHCVNATWASASALDC